jgi:hypothetical protein
MTGAHNAGLRNNFSKIRRVYDVFISETSTKITITTTTPFHRTHFRMSGRDT